VDRGIRFRARRTAALAEDCRRVGGEVLARVADTASGDWRLRVLRVGDLRSWVARGVRGVPDEVERGPPTQKKKEKKERKTKKTKKEKMRKETSKLVSLSLPLTLSHSSLSRGLGCRGHVGGCL
jgi:hypothetical protein